MLQKIRSNLQGVVAYGIVGLLVVVFALWGVEALFLGDPVVDVAKVNGETISELELNEAVYRQRQQLLARLGDRADPTQLDETMLRQPVLNQMIAQRLLLQSAADHDLVISEGMANLYIRQQPEFQVDGAFSAERFDVLIRSNAMTPAKYRESLIEELEVRQLLSGLAGSEFVTPRELELMFAIMDQKRDIETATLGMALGAEHAQLSEGEAQTYYQEHPDEFMTPERVQVEYIEMRLEQFFPEIAEADIVAAYQEAVGQPASAARRRAAHILLDDAAMEDDEAQALLQQLALRVSEGESFEALAAEYSDDVGSSDNGGDLGYTDGSAFPEPFEQALSALAVGELSAPVHTDAGWHLITLTEFEEADVPSLGDKRAEILAQLQREKAEPAYAVKLEELKDISFNAADLESVADTLRLPLDTSTFFGRDGTTEGVFGDQRAIAEAFSAAVLGEGMNSEVVELSPEHAVVLRLLDKQEPQPVPFADVETAIEERLLAEKGTAYLQQRAEEIKTAVAAGQSLADLSEDEHIEYQAHEQLNREKAAALDPTTVAAAFRLPRPADHPSVAIEQLSDGRVVVIVLTAVAAGSLDEFDEDKRNNLQRVLSRYRTERVVGGYRSALHQEADIETML